MNPNDVDLATARGKGPSTAEQKKAAKCPYGCSGDDLSDHGYCRHLIGFVNMDSRTMELRRFVQMKENGPYIERVGGPDGTCRVPHDAILVAIGSCSRVYTKEGIKDYDKFIGLVLKAPSA